MPDEIREPLQTLKYPSNSNRPKQKDIERIQRVTEGPVVQKKKPLGKRFVETFFGDSIHDLPRYIVLDVLLPGVRDGLFDIISYILYPGAGRPRRTAPTTRINGQTFTNYNGISRTPQRTAPIESIPDDRGDLLFVNKFDADKVLEKLKGYLDEYGRVTVGDLYDAAGVTADSSCYKRGWTDLSTARVTHVRDGWILYMPPEGRVD